MIIVCDIQKIISIDTFVLKLAPVWRERCHNATRNSPTWLSPAELSKWQAWTSHSPVNHLLYSSFGVIVIQVQQSQRPSPPSSLAFARRGCDCNLSYPKYSSKQHRSTHSHTPELVERSLSSYTTVHKKKELAESKIGKRGCKQREARFFRLAAMRG